MVQVECNEICFKPLRRSLSSANIRRIFGILYFWLGNKKECGLPFYPKIIYLCTFRNNKPIWI